MRFGWRKVVGAGAVVVASTALTVGAVALQEHPPHVERPAAASEVQTKESPSPSWLAASVVETAKGAAFVQAVNENLWNEAAWWGEIQRQIDAAREAEAAAAARASARSGVHSQAGVTKASPEPSGGGACAPSGNATQHVIDHESGGDPYVIYGGAHAATPFDAGGRAWGCYQLMPSHYAKGGACEGMTDFTPSGQADCAAKLPASAWAGAY